MAQYNPLENKPIHTRMVAEDMFSDKIVQVFSRETGKYLGYVYLGEDPELLQEKLDAEPDAVPEVLPIPKNQLKMFDR
jgi:hypothetical protein